MSRSSFRWRGVRGVIRSGRAGPFVALGLLCYALPVAFFALLDPDDAEPYLALLVPAYPFLAFLVWSVVSALFDNIPPMPANTPGEST